MLVLFPAAWTSIPARQTGICVWRIESDVTEHKGIESRTGLLQAEVPGGRKEDKNQKKIVEKNPSRVGFTW